VSDNIIKVNFKQAHAVEAELVEEIKALVYSYAGRMTNASALGALEMAAHEIKESIYG